jgi:hypothetical protein
LTQPIDLTKANVQFGAVQWRDAGEASSFANFVLDAAPSLGVPEPTTFALLGLGLVGIAASRRRRLS